MVMILLQMIGKYYKYMKNKIIGKLSEYDICLNRLKRELSEYLDYTNNKYSNCLLALPVIRETFTYEEVIKLQRELFSNSMYTTTCSRIITGTFPSYNLGIYTNTPIITGIPTT